jgi:hypothetical protein
MIEYSLGFLEGVNGGKQAFLEQLGKSAIEALKNYIDSNARVNPQALHHMYEWYQTGSPNARLFDIDYQIKGSGISINSTFRQSSTIQNGSNTPFYDKARIMENGVSVVIRPKKSNMLVFEVDGEEVFTKNPVRVNNPGGDVEGRFEITFDTFFNQYFTQSFLRASGILDHLDDISVYKKNLPSGKKMGKSKGYQVGYSWITRAGVAI